LSLVNEEQTTVIINLVDSPETKFSTRVSKPPYLEGTPLVPIIAILFLIIFF